MNQRGVSIVGVLFLLVIAVLVFLNIRLADDVISVSNRHACYDNQEGLHKILWKVCNDRKRPIWDVLTAYTVKYPDARPPVMVVLFRPPIDNAAAGKNVVTVDLSAQIYPTEQLCPSHDEKLVRPAVDYWYALGRWHCMYNDYHSE